MISYKEALTLIKEHTKKLNTVKIPILDSLGFVLAEDIYTKHPIPNFDSSAVDGYTIKINDVLQASEKNPIKLKIKKTIQAGDLKKHVQQNGQTYKIFTGALIPVGTDSVVKLENVIEKSDFILINHIPEGGKNIRFRGEEFSQGEKVLNKGIKINPPVIGLLASLGIKNVKVFRKPKVSIIVTGNELRSFNENIRRGQIRDSNAPSIIVALNAIGIKPVLVSHVKDNLNLITKKIKQASLVSDIIITAGGVSVGDYDFVIEASSSLGFRQVYWKIAMKPGKPNYFGVKGKKLLFGLPGNPVAVLVSFYTLVRYAISLMMGYEENYFVSMRAILTEELEKNEGRLNFVRGILQKNSDGKIFVSPTRGQDSHMLGGIAIANCLIIFPESKNNLYKGSEVEIIPLNWF